MIRAMSVLTVVLAVLVAAPVQSDPERAQKLYEAAGLESWLHLVPDSLRTSFDEAPDQMGMDPELVPRVHTMIDTYFPMEDLTKNALAGLQAGMTSAQMDEVLAFLDTPVGRRATELEVAAQKPGIGARVEAEGTRLFEEMQGSERAEIYHRLAEATRSIEFGVTLGMNLSYAMMSGMMGSPSLPFALTDEQILAMVNQMEPELRDNVIRGTFAELAFTYRDMELDQLRAYADFLETPAARAFYTSQEQALRRFMLPRVQAFGQELMVLIGARRT